MSRTDESLRENVGKPRGPRRTPQERKTLIFGGGGSGGVNWNNDDEEEPNNIRIKANIRIGGGPRDDGNEQVARVVGSPNQ